MRRSWKIRLRLQVGKDGSTGAGAEDTRETSPPELKIKVKGQGKEEKVTAPEVNVADNFKRDPSKREDDRKKRPRSASPLLRRKSIDTDGKRTGTSPSGTPDTPFCVKFKQDK